MATILCARVVVRGVSSHHTTPPFLSSKFSRFSALHGRNLCASTTTGATTAATTKATNTTTDEQHNCCDHEHEHDHHHHPHRHGRRFPSLRLVMGTHSIPHPEKAHDGGEDAFFACHKSNSLGVADGVGGSRTEHISPGDFSRALLSCVHSQVHDVETQLSDALIRGSEALASKGTQGSSTAVVARLVEATQRTPTQLEVVNVGDSTVAVLRPCVRYNTALKQSFHAHRVVFRSHSQTSFFNCPYQLSNFNEQNNLSRKHIEPMVDRVLVTLQPFDVVVAGSDGVFDNIFDEQMLQLVTNASPLLDDEIVAQQKNGTMDTQMCLKKMNEMAKQIAEFTVKQAMRTKGMSPFSMAAAFEGFQTEGGKLDDVALVCGLVVPAYWPAEGLPTCLVHNFKESV